MPRADIRMTDAETRAFLAEKHEVVVVVSLAADDPVTAALDRDPRVCVVAEQFPSYFEVRSVVVHGHADLAALAGGNGRRELRVRLGDDVVTFDFAKMQPPAD
jgi:hypothetical protein